LAQQPAVVRGTAADIRVLRPLVNEVIAPGSFLLELSFQSRTAAGIRAAELHVDGVRWARRDFDMPLAKYVLSFDVDGRTLVAGSHRLVVKLVGADGSIAETEVPVQVDAPRPLAPTRPVGGGGYGPEMSFRALPKKLVGTVEVGVAIKEEHLNPYVSFFVDRQFKTLKNYPPYSFVWDTTTVANGYHVIEATGYLESSNATTTQRMQVYVDNPGGFTTKAAPDAVARVAETKPSTVVAPKTSAPVVVPVAAAARLSAVPAAAVKVAPAALAPLSRPSDIDAAPSLAAAVAPAGAAVAVRTERVAQAREFRGATVAPMGLSAVPSASRETTVGRPTAIAPVSVAQPKVAALAGPVRRAVSPVAPRPKAPVATPLAVLPEINLAKKISVAFDGVQIAFDVQPRIENGLPLAPFRQIFEHTGGTVTWAHQAKTVRAVNAEREVVFKVGSQTGRVNGETVRLDRKATIENGRAIVPLSFVGSALEVDIDFDPATGRLSINSKK
jgi:hypothetical protein